MPHRIAQRRVAGRETMKALRWLSLLGPGLITGASDDDPSGVGTYAQAGAQFGSGMAWAMVLTFPLMASVQIISARVARVTGKGLAANLSSVLPRWLLIVLLVALFATNALNIGADLAAMGEAMTLLVPGPAVGYALAFGLFSGAAIIFVPYSRYVGVLKWLTLVLLAYVGSVCVVDVSWRTVLHDVFVPPLRLEPAYLQTLVAVLGTTISPYLFFWQSAQEVEEQEVAPQDAPLKIAPAQAGRQLRKVRIDTVIGMALSNLVGIFIMLTTAATLHKAGIQNIDSAAQAAQALKPIGGSFAFALFATGIIGTGLLAIPVLAASCAYALSEALGWKRGLEKQPRAAPAFYGTIALATAIGILLPVMHFNAMRALVLTAVVNGVIAVPILIAMMRAAQSASVMGTFTLGRGLAIAGWATTALMTLAALGLLL